MPAGPRPGGLPAPGRRSARGLRRRHGAEPADRRRIGAVGPRLARDRSRDVLGPNRRRGRHPRQSQPPLRGLRVVGALQVDQRRRHLRAGLRGRWHAVDRGDRGAAGRPGRGVRGHRGGRGPQQHLDRRRHLPEHRRRGDLDAPRPRRHGALLAHRHPSPRPPDRLRGGDGPRLGTERGAGTLSQPGRRRHLGTHPPRERDHRRERRRPRPARPRHRLRRHVRLPAAALALPQRGPGQRPLPLDRRRRQLDAPHGSGSGERSSRRGRHRARRNERARRGSEPRLRPHRVAGGGGALALRRPRDHLADGQRRAPPQQPSLLLHPGARRPGGSGPRLHARRAVQRLDGRGAHLRRPRREHVRRPPRPLD